jgi:CDP-diacylglycerol--serine O-phosphatidyltransferase
LCALEIVYRKIVEKFSALFEPAFAEKKFSSYIKRMRRIYILPNVVTAFGLACGLFVIFHSSMSGLDTYEMLRQSLLIVLLAAVADVVDGAVARAVKGESEFGLMFDSMADMVSFGVAPSVLFLKAVDVGVSGPYPFFAIAAAMLYTLCGALRLVRFNLLAGAARVTPQEDKSFKGVPIPAAAAAAIAPALFLNSPLFESWVSISEELKCMILAPIMIFIAYLMISRWRFASIKTLRIKIPSFQLMFFTVVGAIALLYGILHYLSIVIIVLFWGYIIIGLILSIVRKIAGRKSKKLLDFEAGDDHEED